MYMTNSDTYNGFDLPYKKSLKIPRGNHNPYIEEEQTPQCPKEKVQKDK
jgi:hypothetical protein